MRTVKNEIAFSFGCPINAHVNEYLPPDAVAVMLTSMLSVGIGLKNAATLVREHWEKWLELVQRAERDPKLGQTILPPSDQLFLTVGIRDDDRLLVEAGLMHETMWALASSRSYLNVHGVSIQRVLHQLRTNARVYVVEGPVIREPVSVPKFPVQREKSGNIPAFRGLWAVSSSFQRASSMAWTEIPYEPKQGISKERAGNLDSATAISDLRSA